MYIYSCCKRLHAKHRLGKTKLLEIVSTSNIRAVSYVLTILDGDRIPSAPIAPCRGPKRRIEAGLAHRAQDDNENPLHCICNISTLERVVS